MGTLEVWVENALNVPNVETFGKSDPYVQVEFQGVSQKTDVIKGELNPVFKQRLGFELQNTALKPGDELKVYLKDWEMVGRNRLLGQTTVPLKDVIKTRNQSLTLALVDGNSRPTQCKLCITLTYNPPPSSDSSEQSGRVIGGGEEGEFQRSKKNLTKSLLSFFPVHVHDYCFCCKFLQLCPIVCNVFIYQILIKNIYRGCWRYCTC